jgi:hypothetical protein
MSFSVRCCEASRPWIWLSCSLLWLSLHLMASAWKALRALAMSPISGGMRDDAVHVPLGEAQDDAVEVGERLGDDAPEHIADRGERPGDDHGEQRR